MSDNNNDTKIKNNNPRRSSRISTLKRQRQEKEKHNEEIKAKMEQEAKRAKKAQKEYEKLKFHRPVAGDHPISQDCGILPSPRLENKASATPFVPLGFICGFPITTSNGEFYTVGRNLYAAATTLTPQGIVVYQTVTNFGNGETLPFRPCKCPYIPLVYGTRQMVACHTHELKRRTRLRLEGGKCRDGEALPSILFWNNKHYLEQQQAKKNENKDDNNNNNYNKKVERNNSEITANNKDNDKGGGGGSGGELKECKDDKKLQVPPQDLGYGNNNGQKQNDLN